MKEYWPVIGCERSGDTNTGLWLIDQLWPVARKNGMSKSHFLKREGKEEKKLTQSSHSQGCCPWRTLHYIHNKSHCSPPHSIRVCEGAEKAKCDIKYSRHNQALAVSVT